MIVGLGESLPYLERQVERRMADLQICRYLGVTLPWWEADPTPAITHEKQVGEACKNTLLALCQPIYQEKLFVACRSCPGPKKG